MKTSLLILFSAGCVGNLDLNESGQAQAITAGTTRYEAEAAATNLQSEARFGGFSGSSYLCCWESDNQVVTFKVNVQKAGEYAIAFGFSAGAGGATRQLLVNGAVVNGKFPFSTTGTWTEWARATATVTLNAGENSIALNFLGSSQFLNLDYLDVADGGSGRYEAELAHTNLPTETTWRGFSGSSYLCCWNGDGQYVTFDVNAASGGSYKLSFGYSAGAGAASRQLLVNGAGSELDFPATADWTSWSRVESTVQLKAGANTVTLNFLAGSHQFINLDFLDVGSDGAADMAQMSDMGQVSDMNRASDMAHMTSDMVGGGGSDAGSADFDANRCVAHIPASASASTIQQMLNATHVGDSVCFDAGTFNINLGGGGCNHAAFTFPPGRKYGGVPGATILKYTDSSSCFLAGVLGGANASSDSILLYGLTFHGGGVSMLDGGANHITIENCIFENINLSDSNYSNGITFTGGMSNIKILNNKFRGGNSADNANDAAMSNGVYGYNFTNVQVSYNSFDNVFEPFHAYPYSPSSGLEISHNDFQHVHRHAMEIQGPSSNVAVNYNTFSNWTRDTRWVDCSVSPCIEGHMAISGAWGEGSNNEVVGNVILGAAGKTSQDSSAIEIMGTNSRVVGNFMRDWGWVVIECGRSGWVMEDNILCGDGSRVVPDGCSNGAFFSQPTVESGHSADQSLSDSSSTCQTH